MLQSVLAHRPQAVKVAAAPHNTSTFELELASIVTVGKAMPDHVFVELRQTILHAFPFEILDAVSSSCLLKCMFGFRK